ncbi:hypothetical protein KKF82_07550 [Patescibacteria group bacterium]|nr:hypothetical protein [Patescibacteria group bacterium]
MSILITEKYKEINHPILKDICTICEEQFKVGDSIEMVPIQKSKNGESFNLIVIMIHTDCYYV